MIYECPRSRISDDHPADAVSVMPAVCMTCGEHEPLTSLSGIWMCRLCINLFVLGYRIGRLHGGMS